jgi:hypothetical protein
MRDIVLRTALLGLALSGACERKAPVATPAVADDGDARTTVRTDGWGALRFGMDVAAAKAASGASIDAPAEGCVQLSIGTDTPEGVTWMFHDGVLARLDVRSPELRTDAGAKVGTSAAELRRLYPDAVAGPNKYDPEGGTWVAGPAEAAHYVFELDRSERVTRWRAGIPPQIDWVEGCG